MIQFLIKLPALILVGTSAAKWLLHSLPQQRLENQGTWAAGLKTSKIGHYGVFVAHIYPLLYILVAHV